MSALSYPPPSVNASERVAAILARLPALAEEIGRGAAERDLARELPFAIFRRIREEGIGTLRIPERLGGPGGSIADVIHALSVLATGDSNVAHALRSHFHFSETLRLAPDLLARSDDARLILEGFLFGGGHTELGTARPGEVTALLAKAPRGYRLNGRKYYTTGSAFADFLSISAVNEQGEPVQVRLPVGRPGVEILDDWDGMGQRLTASGGIELSNVEVGEDEFILVARGGPASRHVATFRQLVLMACQAGSVRSLLAEAIDYTRKQARPITHSHAETAREDLFVQRQVGELAAISHTIDVLIADAAATLDRSAAALLGGDPGSDRIITESAISVARAQIVLGPLALQAAEGIFNVGGASATSRRRNFDRHWRNIRTIMSHNPLFYKEQVVGDYLLNGTLPPNEGGFF